MDGQNFNNQQPVYQQPAYQQPAGGAPVPTGDKPNGMSIASLVLGIVGIVVGCCSGLFGLILGIIGVVLGVLGNKNNKTKFGTAALIVSIVACGWSIISWIIGIIFLNSANNAMTDLINSLS